MPTVKFPLLLLDGNPHRVVSSYQPLAAIFDNSVSGVPHCPTKDDVYEGYHIPFGSIVIFNSWYERNYVKGASS